MFLVGGGGGSKYGSHWVAGAGGGYTKTEKLIISQGDSLDVVIGAGGFSYNSSNGGVTKVGSTTVAGGYGNHVNRRYGGNGGSGGGEINHNGGSDGSDGEYSGSIAYPADNQFSAGQHTTTRAFGESTGTLYAGGGGGGTNGSSQSRGVGGAGGGGNGASQSYSTPRNGDSGAANTGGGGGGGGYGWLPDNGTGTSGWGCSSGGNGGSGIAIIRWGY